MTRATWDTAAEKGESYIQVRCRRRGSVVGGGCLVTPPRSAAGKGGSDGCDTTCEAGISAKGEAATLGASRIPPA